VSVGYPIFPGFKPGKTFTVPPAPVRSPTWNFKETFKFQNFLQQAVSGRTTVIKYWSNPLRLFEWKYGYIKDNPLDQNAFYPVAIPSTDFDMLKGFFIGMQGMGNEFAYTPPGYQSGGTWPVTAVAISGTVVTFTATGAGTALAAKVGYPILALNTGIAGINNQYMYVTSTSGANTVVCSFTGASGSAGTAGCITIGNVLANPDANDNVELTYTSGSYPNLSGTSYAGTVVPVVESVQLIDPTTLVVYDGNGLNITSDMTLAAPNSVNPPTVYAPYVGYVLQFGTFTPAALPLTASFNLYFLCRFAEDMQEYENFMAACWLATIKFQQIRI
jgi:hypothetical protein